MTSESQVSRAVRERGLVIGLTRIYHVRVHANTQDCGSVCDASQKHALYSTRIRGGEAAP